MAAAISPFMRLYCNPPIVHDMNDVQCMKGRSYPFPTGVWVLLRPLRFDQWKKDERDKANGLTSSLNDAIILKGCDTLLRMCGILISVLANVFSSFRLLVKKSSSIDPETPEKAIISVFKSYLEVLNANYFAFLCKHCRENSKSLRRSARRHVRCCQCSYTDNCSV